MKYLLTPLLVISTLSSCGKDVDPTSYDYQEPTKNDTISNDGSNIINVKIGDNMFTATLSNNAASSVFKSMLPITLNMNELNGNEKYVNLNGGLPMSNERVGMVKSGDIMLFGSNTLVLFYQTFATSYSYTKIASIDNPSQLEVALGGDGVEVAFDIKK